MKVNRRTIWVVVVWVLVWVILAVGIRLLDNSEADRETIEIAERLLEEE